MEIDSELHRESYNRFSIRGKTGKNLFGSIQTFQIQSNLFGLIQELTRISLVSEKCMNSVGSI